MAIDVTCTCGKRYRVAETLAGKAVTCKACGQRLKIPASVDSTEDWQGIEDDAAPIPVITKPGVGATTPSRGAFDSLVVNTRTVASNPGRMRIDYVRYLMAYPAMLVVFIVMLLIAGAVVVMGGKLVVAGVLAAAGVWTFGQDLLSKGARFRSGDINPAVVVGERPWRVAVYTDLRTGPSGSKPAIKIMNAPLGRMSGGPAKVGDRLATASHYYGPGNADAWNDFDPTIVQCVTGNEADIARVMAGIPASQWRELDAALGRLPDRKPGIYKLWQSTKNAGISEFGKLAVRAVVLVAIAVPLVAIAIHSSLKRATVPVKKNTPMAPLVFQKPAPHAIRPIQPRTSPGLQKGLGTKPTGTILPASAPVLEYQTGQKVEILWGATWYPGKVLRREGENYFVHYDSWGDSSDEAVAPARLRPSQNRAP